MDLSPFRVSGGELSLEVNQVGHQNSRQPRSKVLRIAGELIKVLASLGKCHLHDVRRVKLSTKARPNLC